MTSVGIQQSIAKYGYTEQCYYQLKKAFLRRGSPALAGHKTKPKSKTVRTDTVQKHIIRLRFIDPKASASVLTKA